MYIPHEIGDKVYFFTPYSKELNSWFIESVTITQEWTIRFIDSETMKDGFWMDLKENQFYPSKAIAKEELLRRAVEYANEVLIDK